MVRMMYVPDFRGYVSLEPQFVHLLITLWSQIMSQKDWNDLCPPLLNQISLKYGNNDSRKSKKRQKTVGRVYWKVNYSEVSIMIDFMILKIHACVGGTAVRDDIRTLQDDIHLVVGTPGRVHGMIQRRALRLYSILMLC